jgi:dihydrolipoamide dehydrogenase
MSENFDVAVIGAGPGGYVAAIRASQLGLKVAIIERENLGGVCLNWGCIPTKALLKSSEIFHVANHLSHYGLNSFSPTFDIKNVVERSRNVASQLSSGIKHLMKKNKVQVFEGHAKLAGHGKIDIGNDGQKEQIHAKNIIIATGARARVMPGFEPDGDLVWAYREALTPKSMPKSLIIVGSGAIGIEFASFYSNMGAEVTILEMQEYILPVEDKEISLIAKKMFEKQGIKIVTQAGVKSLKKEKDHVILTFQHDGKVQEIQADRVIMAVGIVPNTENLGLEKTKIILEKGHIVTNEFLETAEKGTYAIGDVVKGPWLAHKASHEAIIAAERIAGKESKALNRDNIPGCTYSMPQIASIGMTEEGATKAGYLVKIGRFPFMASGKAVAIGDTDGMVKVIFDQKTGELLGAHMVGPDVTELVSTFVLAKTLEATEMEIMHSIFPHPTLSEAMHESVLDAYKRAIHI